MKKALTCLWQCSLIALLMFSMMATTACSTDEVLTTIDVALQTAANLDTAIGAVSPADAQAISALTAAGTSGINAIKQAYDTYEKEKTANAALNVVAVAQAIQTTLPQQLAAFHITSSDAVQKTTAWVNLITDVAAAAVAVATQHPALALNSQKARISVPASFPSGAIIQARWQSDVCRGDAKCGKLVKVRQKHHLFG